MRLALCFLHDPCSPRTGQCPPPMMTSSRLLTAEHVSPPYSVKEQWKVKLMSRCDAASHAAAGPCPCFILPFLLKGGKTLENGKVSYVGSTHHVDPTLCPHGSLGQHIICRITLDRSPSQIQRMLTDGCIPRCGCCPWQATFGCAPRCQHSLDLGRAHCLG